MPSGVHSGRRGNGPTRTDDQRLADRKEMLKLLRRGWTKTDIAEKQGVSNGIISRDTREMLRWLRESRDESTHDHITIKLEEYGEVKREAWEAWERSKKPIRRMITETYVKDDGSTATRARYDKVGHTGDKQYLEIVLKCLIAERELLALDPPKKVKLDAQIINWDVLANGMPPGPVPDMVEEAIKSVMVLHSTALDALEEQHGLGEKVVPPTKGG